MDRSTKHGPRTDEQMAHEVRGQVQAGGRSTHAEEWREAEPAGEDQPTGDVEIVPEGRRGTPEGMTQADVETRSDLARYLGTSAFPGERETLLGKATENGAPDRVIDLLSDLPAGREFVNVQEVAVTLGIGVETRQ